MDEIINALKRMKVVKAAGYDRVSSEMLREGGDIVIILLYQLFNKCWSSRKIPNNSRKTVIVPFYKGKDLQQICTNYHPISFLSDVMNYMQKSLLKEF
ncbi:hypothetical protein EVAR_11403_1 [Eumeta japonica]|uniref:Uncharacterized protein n=1 Tax=Eumeta variegata TaxID=151549 RepID=A0A4C1TNC0_EUMVA|nr:hypothetical protein EVAR_11403_1 [Eumeta japonica]